MVDLSQEWSMLYKYAAEINDIGYANVVCKFPKSIYLQRIRNIDFINQERVLDVGCGYGQWSYALAHSNKHVTALELNKSRLYAAEKFLNSEKISNVTFVEGTAVNMPFENDSFDLLFCYGVFMFIPRIEALKEFHRVLKPNGKLYICTNGPGWWSQLFFKTLFSNPSVCRASLRALLFGNQGALPNSTRRKNLRNLLNEDLWSDLICDVEGRIGKTKYDPELRMYKGRFLGMDAVIEFIATKSAQ